MRSLLFVFLLLSVNVISAEAKQAQYYDFGQGATITMLDKQANGQVVLVNGKPSTHTAKVLWITKAVFQSAPVSAGGDGVLEEVYIYQLENGQVWHTVAAMWKDPVFAAPTEADPSKNVTEPKIIPGSRCGDILKITGELLPTPTKMHVDVFCRCNGEIKSRKWVRVMMDGKEHEWPDDK